MVGVDCRDQAEQAKCAFVDPERFVHDVDAAIAQGKDVRFHELRDVRGRVFERDYLPVVEDDDEWDWGRRRWPRARPSVRAERAHGRARVASRFLTQGDRF